MNVLEALAYGAMAVALVAGIWLIVSALAWMRDVDAALDGEYRDDWLADGAGEGDE